MLYNSFWYKVLIYTIFCNIIISLFYLFIQLLFDSYKIIRQGKEKIDHNAIGEFICVLFAVATIFVFVLKIVKILSFPISIFSIIFSIFVIAQMIVTRREKFEWNQITTFSNFIFSFILFLTIKPLFVNSAENNLSSLNNGFFKDILVFFYYYIYAFAFVFSVFSIVSITINFLKKVSPYAKKKLYFKIVGKRITAIEYKLVWYKMEDLFQRENKRFYIIDWYIFLCYLLTEIGMFMIFEFVKMFFSLCRYLFVNILRCFESIFDVDMVIYSKKSLIIAFFIIYGMNNYNHIILISDKGIDMINSICTVVIIPAIIEIIQEMKCGGNKCVKKITH